MTLTARQQTDFERDGFLLIEGFVAGDACEALIERAGQLVAAFDPGSVRSVFSTTDQTHTTDDYFLTSGDKIRFFFEEEAHNDDGRLIRDKSVSINKIGHALHDLDPVFERFSRSPALADVVTGLGVAEPLLLQSMYIFKPPEIGGEVVCHQDSTFLYTDPPSVIGLWFALQDATLENGCLQALPGGHKRGLKRRFRRDGKGGVTFDEFDPTPFPDTGIVPLEAPQGTLIVLHGALPHLSGANRSPRWRQAYALHVIDGVSRYPSDNWLQRDRSMPPRGFA